MKYLILLFIFIVSCDNSMDNDKIITFERVMGGIADDEIETLLVTSDNSILVGAEIRSSSSNVSNIHIQNIDMNGDTIWVQNINSDNHEFLSNSIEESDGYFFTGEQITNDRNYILIFKLAKDGTILWKKTLNEVATYSTSLVKIENGYSLIGRTFLNDQIYIVNIDKNGNVLSLVNYDTELSEINDVRHILVNKNEIVLTGSYRYSGAMQIFIIKLDSLGNELWRKSYGRDLSDWPRSIQQTKGGDLLICGRTPSLVNDNPDGLLIKLDKSGNLLWEKSYGLLGDEVFNSFTINTDGSIVLAGYTESVTNDNISDVYIVKVDKNGNEIWTQTYGGSSYDEANNIVHLPSGGYIVGGFTRSFGNGKRDMYLLKINEKGEAHVE